MSEPHSSEGGRIEDFRQRLASSSFAPLEDTDPALAERAREELVSEFMRLVGIAIEWRDDVLSAVRIERGDGLIRITLGSLGTVTGDWDGSTSMLESIASQLALSFADTYKEDLGRYVTTPGDEV